MKYVVFNNDTFALLPESASHDDVVKHKLSVLGAGFCRIESFKTPYDDIKFKVQCWGESITLNIKSRGMEDANIIQIGLS